MLVRDSKSRLEALRKLLLDGELSTQEELREKLEKMDFAVNQSTISRDLRKLGAIKATDTLGQTVYQLAEEYEPPAAGTMNNLVVDIRTNGYTIVIRTSIGSASLVARHLDRVGPEAILGTIAGDDTIFVAPTSVDPREMKATIRAIRESVAHLG